ncbi:MAG: DUF3253 domain-containing protein [Burkholderiales bacterium]|jgi:hypothetical protein|nr:DUF3253 domain-containing protein [Burkholderiales bacterium]
MCSRTQAFFLADLVHSPTSDAAVEAVIRQLLASRSATRSACPSEAARALSADQWRPLMPLVRRVAATMALRGELLITQGSTVVDPQHVLDGTLRGPLRLRRGR